MKVKQLLTAALVAGRVPTLPIPLSYDWERGEDAASAVTADDRVLVETYRRESKAACRALSAQEIDTVISRLVE